MSNRDKNSQCVYDTIFGRPLGFLQPIRLYFVWEEVGADLPIEQQIIHLEAIAAYAVAINLAYLNLPSLRFAERIKDRIRLLIDGYDSSTYPHVDTSDPRYKSLYKAGRLEDFHLLIPPKPEVAPNQDGGWWVHIFTDIWCTPIRIDSSTIPVDKVFSAILLVISSFYLFVIAVLRADQVAELDTLSRLMFFGVYAPSGILLFYFYRKDDRITLGIIALALGYSAYCIHTPASWPFTLDTNTFHITLILLSLCILIPTILVLLSFGLYGVAETHYISMTKGVFNSATAKAPRKGARA